MRESIAAGVVRGRKTHPFRTGLGALRELKQVASHAKIIIFSGFSEGTAREEAIQLGADLYLQKGANADAINDAMAVNFLDPTVAAAFVVQPKEWPESAQPRRLRPPKIEPGNGRSVSR